MKKLLLLCAFAIIGFSSTAQSSLTVFSEEGTPFYIFLNGVRQNANAELNVKIDFLPNEYYSTKIVFDDTNIPTIEKKTLMVIDADGRSGDMTYKLKRNRKGKMLMRFYSFTEYQQIPPPPTVTVIEYNTIPLPVIGTTTTTTTTTNSGGDNVNVGVNIGGVSIGMDVTINDGLGNGSSTTTTTTTTTGIPTDVVVVEEVADCYTLTSDDFNEALASIEDKTFSDSKLTLAKQITKRNCLTAKQIKRIITLFDYESTKLEYAKFAYPYCYNPENYWKVNDAFEYESSIEELDAFIGKQ